MPELKDLYPSVDWSLIIEHMENEDKELDSESFDDLYLCNFIEEKT